MSNYNRVVFYTIFLTFEVLNTQILMLSFDTKMNIEE